MLPLKRETTAIAELLAAGDETPEALANAVIKKLDEVRGERTTHYVLLRMGHGQATTFYGFGPYSTKNQALKSIEKNPTAQLATAMAVVPTTSSEGLDQLIASVDSKPEVKGDWLVVKQDAEAFKNKPKRSRKW